MNTIFGTQKEIDTLHTVAKEVTFPLSEEIIEFIKLMQDTLNDGSGFEISLGLAANQIINVDTRPIPKIFIALIDSDLDEIDNEPDTNFLYTVFINPTIVTSGKKINTKESCLSIPNKSFKVKRRKNVEITYYNLDGNKITKKFFGGVTLSSIIIQHEYDHLIGKLIDGQ